MPELTSKNLSQRLSKRLANYKLKDDVIAKLADRVLIDGLDLKRFDVCIYGICIDYYTDKVPKLDGILSRIDVARLEVFPYGIIDWDRFQWAAPGRDLAYLGAWSWAAAIRGGNRPDWKILEHACEVYKSARPHVDVDRQLPFHIAAGLLRICHSIVHLWPEDGRYLGPLLAEALRQVQ